MTHGVVKNKMQFLSWLFCESAKNEESEKCFAQIIIERLFHFFFRWEPFREDGSPSSRRHDTSSLPYGFLVSTIIIINTAIPFLHSNVNHRCDWMRISCAEADSSNIHELCSTKGIKSLHRYLTLRITYTVFSFSTS